MSDVVVLEVIVQVFAFGLEVGTPGFRYVCGVLEFLSLCGFGEYSVVRAVGLRGVGAES